MPENLKTRMMLPLLTTGGARSDRVRWRGSAAHARVTHKQPSYTDRHADPPFPNSGPPNGHGDRRPTFSDSNAASANADGNRCPHAPPAQTTDTLLEEKTFSFLEHLTAEFSPRESATDEELAAAHFLRNELEDLGYDVYIQDFDATRPFAEVRLARVPDADSDEIETLPIWGSIEGTGTGTLADAGKAFEEDIPDGGLDGKVALIERGNITFEEKVTRVADAGAVAAIVFNNQEGNFRGALRSQSNIPAVSLTRADGLDMLALMDEADITAEVSVGTRPLPLQKRHCREAGQFRVRRHGSRRERTTTTTPDTQGANDNGSGLSVVMTMAELTVDTDYPFTLKFVLFGAEEIGLFGSRHYVDAPHRAGHRRHYRDAELRRAGLGRTSGLHRQP